MIGAEDREWTGEPERDFSEADEVLHADALHFGCWGGNVGQRGCDGCELLLTGGRSRCGGGGSLRHV